MRALRSDYRELATVALAVLRRWLLALKAMTWLETASLARWDDIRPQDLACFAFSSVRPDWPRRVVAVSHRSADVKPALVTMRAWRSSRFAIDASFVPAWETNNGMVWALFGATPAIARVHSSGYYESVWCRREAELMQYLIERADFVSDRLVLDLEQSALRSLDKAYTVWNVSDVPQAIEAAFSEFPPLSQVWTPSPMPDWEVKMFRASAALRAMNVLLGPDPDLTNEVVGVFLRGRHDLPFSPPTNNPGGWDDYASIFIDLQGALGADATEPALRVPPDYGNEVLYDDELLERVPDLSSGEPALGDVLVALEFLRTEWPILVDQRQGRLLAVNCRGLSRETFAGDDRLSVHRGLLAIRLPVPIWVIQTAGQEVETWGLPGDPPIFTEHVPNQFSWMMEIFVERSVMQARYPQDSSLELSSTLRLLCRQGQ